MSEQSTKAPMTTSEVTNRDLVGRLAKGMWRGVRRRQLEVRYLLAREYWATTKRFATGDEIPNIDVADLPGLRDAIATAYVDDPNRAVLSVLCEAAGARTFFEIGTNRGRTALSVARTNPEIEVTTLDLPSPEAGGETELDLTDADKRLFTDWRRGEAFAGEPEEERITQVLGDSANFDFSPYEGTNGCRLHRRLPLLSLRHQRHPRRRADADRERDDRLGRLPRLPRSDPVRARVGAPSRRPGVPHPRHPDGRLEPQAARGRRTATPKSARASGSRRT